jgi:hypothetical protein
MQLLQHRPNANHHAAETCLLWRSNGGANKVSAHTAVSRDVESKPKARKAPPRYAGWIAARCAKTMCRQILQERSDAQTKFALLQSFNPINFSVASNFQFSETVLHTSTDLRFLCKSFSPCCVGRPLSKVEFPLQAVRHLRSLPWRHGARRRRNVPPDQEKAPPRLTE